MNHFKILGKLNEDVIAKFKKEILRLKKNDDSYQWILLDDIVEEMFLDLFIDLPLKIQINKKNQKVQKIFYSKPGHGFRIHKDGLQCKSALNIAISSNESDWVRWYDETHVNKLTFTVDRPLTEKWGNSRDTVIQNYEDIDFIDQLKVTTGFVYLLDVDTFHSFKCNGPEPRIILQTKFENFPSFKELSQSITSFNFKELLNV